MALTPYMSLDLPTPTVTLGPEWAEQLNAALEFIDAHDHTSGKGKLITSAAININSDLSINSKNLTSARSYNFQNLGTPISGPADVRSLYVTNGELYYNDGDGTQIQLTDNGGLNASTIGGIGGDYAPPAAVNYNSISKTYLFYQNSGTGLRAKLDTADILLRDDAVGANAITLKSPASLAASYDFRFPNALPLQNRVLQISPTGDVDPVLITDSLLDVDAVTNTKISDNAVTTNKIANGNVTAAKIDSTANVATLVKEKFTNTGSTFFIVPTGLLGNKILVRGWGGGGGGGNGGTDGVNQRGGGGGGGAVLSQLWVSLDGFVQNIKTFAPANVNVTTNVITIPSHGFQNGDIVRFNNSTPANLPGGIGNSTVYFVKNTTTNTFEVSVTYLGPTVDIITAGVGTHEVRRVLEVFVGAGGTGAPGAPSPYAPGSPGENSFVRLSGNSSALWTGWGGAGGNHTGQPGGINPLSSPGSFTFLDIRNMSIAGGTGGIGGLNGNAGEHNMSPSLPGFIGYAGGVLGTGNGNWSGGGGGGGGPGGPGGHGDGVNFGPLGYGGSAAANSGGGGGGGARFNTLSTAGGNGGSGLVEISYWTNVNP